MARYSSSAQMERSGEGPPPRPAVGRGAWSALVMLSFVYVLNFLSRQLPAILAKPIQDNLRVSDGKLGLIGGLYFALFYCCISIPVGFIADRTSRSKILAAACAIWSVATMCCGVAASYPQFVMAYMAVGLGEAGGVPPSYAIISDYFPPGKRGAALSLFNLGPGIGITLGIAFGASIAAAFNWRYAFLVLGSIGLFAAVGVLAVVREPRRGGLDGISAPAAKAGFRQTFAMFFSRRTLRLAALAAGATQFVTYGLTNFTVLFLMREKGMALKQVAVYYSLTVLLGMGASMFVSGRMIDRFTRDCKRAYALIPAATLGLAIPFYLAFVGARSWRVALLLLVAAMFLNYFYLSSMVTLIQEEVRPEQRVMSGAMLLLVMNLIGLGLGPTYVGAVSDAFHGKHPHDSLQMALYLLAPFYLVAIGLFLELSRALHDESSTAGETVR